MNSIESGSPSESSQAQQLPPEIAALLENIGHALAQAPKALLLVNEEAEVVSPFLHSYLADHLRRSAPGRQVALFEPKHDLGPTAALAEALSEFIPGLTAELFLSIPTEKRLSFVRMMLGKEAAGKKSREPEPASHILVVDRLEEARSGQHDDRAEFCNLLDSLAQEPWFGVAIAIGLENDELCEKAAGLSALLRQSSRVCLQTGKFKLAGSGRSGGTRRREPRTDRPRTPAPFLAMLATAGATALITAAVFLGGARYFGVDWNEILTTPAAAEAEGEPTPTPVPVADTTEPGKLSLVRNTDDKADQEIAD